MIHFTPKFTITQIERARGFLEAAKLSTDWLQEMSDRALILEAHHTTHIEGTRLTLDQAKRLWKGEKAPEADREDVRELLNYRSAFEFVSESLDKGDPITEGMIREIHRRLVQGVRGGKAAPGEYRRIRNVREKDMDLTGWLDYFVTGLKTQMIEVKQRGEQVIRRDVLARKHGLNDRQIKALGFIIENGKMTIQDFEVLCSDVNRRSLQRDLKEMINKKLISAEGATNQLVYHLAG
jgi:predicted HTH transcriptional regulator